ncbi:MAG: conjugative transposon protein TraM, partial [Odoribacter sp.]|nr:conjugative transposon protein TraM [Odoribacter sp.]
MKQEKEPKTVNETEELKRRQKRKSLLFYPAIGLLFIGIIYLIFSPSSEKDGKTNGETVLGYNADIPLPVEAELFDDKKSAYELASIGQSTEEKRKKLEDYAATLEQQTADSMLISDSRTDNEPVENSIRQSGNAYRNIHRELHSFYTPRDTEKEALKKQVEELTARLDAATAQQQSEKQLELMEKSYQMASRYLTGGGGQPASQSDVPALKEPPFSEGTATPVSSVREQVVSRLRQEIPDSVFTASTGQRRNLGFITAVGREKKEAGTEKNTISACIYADQTLVFGQDEGEQYVALRILEEMQAGNVVLPRNSTVSGIAKLQSGRVGLQIVSVEYQGCIIPVELTVYDTDGQPGINVPGSAEVNALKEAAANAGGSLGTSVSFTQNAGQQVAMDLTKGLMQSGSQYLSKKIRTVKIHLKAGYRLFLLT